MTIMKCTAERELIEYHTVVTRLVSVVVKFFKFGHKFLEIWQVLYARVCRQELTLYSFHYIFTLELNVWILCNFASEIEAWKYPIE